MTNRGIPLDLTARTVLVTGGSSGIGRETAVVLSELGARVIVSGRRTEELDMTPGAHALEPFDSAQSARDSPGDQGDKMARSLATRTIDLDDGRCPLRSMSALPPIDLVTAGSHGDVHPFLGVAHQLQRRGHPVRVFSMPHFAPAAAAAGVPFVAVGHDNYEEAVTEPRLFDPLRGGGYAFRLRLEGIPASEEVLGAAWRERKPAAVLGNPLCLGLRWACEEAGVPLVLAHLAPMTLFSRADPVPALQQTTGAVARTVARWGQPLVRAVLSHLVQRQLAPLRAARGLPPQRDLLARESYGGVETLGLWSPAFRGPQRDDPPNTRICGFPWWDRAENETLPVGLEEFLASGPPPICFSLGSAVAWQPGDFYEKAIAVSVALGTRALLLTRDRRGVPAQVPAGSFVASYVPHSRVLPHVRAFVHHGGIGTTAQGLRAGVPALVVPHAHDQFHNGLHVAALQAGRMVRRSQLTLDRFVHELKALLDDPALVAGSRVMAAILRDEDGAACAAQRVSAIACGQPLST